MIKANLDKVDFEGNFNDIAAEFCTVSKNFKDLCIEELGGRRRKSVF